jgi:cyclopropane fatty-acyl-phospholipid synthase-like methyltransferase
LTEYRWNVSDAASGYDRAASHIHPHYLAIQDVILDELVAVPTDGLIVDLGAGSGRLAERILDRFPNVSVAVVDQSESFLGIAAKRLQRFGDRAQLLLDRLQSGWEEKLPTQPVALVSMSAIHHLTPVEKQSLYARCGELLGTGGLFLNGDEVRPASEQEYRKLLEKWWLQMQQIISAGLVSQEMAQVLEAWKRRNLDEFENPRASGDDCHETIEAQLEYLTAAGFNGCSVSWQQELWAVMRAAKT